MNEKNDKQDLSMGTADLFNVKFLFLNRLPSKLIVFLIPISLVLMVLMPDRNWYLLLGFSIFVTLISIGHYYLCKERHERLLRQYGADYLKVLKTELSIVGIHGLLDRYWIGLEPKQTSRPFTNECAFCGKKLGDPDDALSADCGGHCWECIHEIENNIGKKAKHE